MGEIIFKALLIALIAICIGAIAFVTYMAIFYGGMGSQSDRECR